MSKNKMDRRTIYTLNVIKEAFLKLINQEEYAKITVTQVCKEADITRSTFYIHYNNLNDVLNKVLDEALAFSDGNVPAAQPVMVGEDSLLPACQRIAGAPKYRKILMDPDLSEYIIGRIAAHERDRVIPDIQRKTGLDDQQADILFQYMIHGSFAINKRHHFTKDAAWYQEVKMLNDFVNAGYRAFKKSGQY